MTITDTLDPAGAGSLEEHSYAAKRKETYNSVDAKDAEMGSVPQYGTLPPVPVPHHHSGCCPTWLRDEFLTLFNLAWTMVLITVLTNLLAPIGLMFVGHLGIEELGGVALGNTVLNIFGNAIGIGLSSACDTFFAQTYGSGNRKKVGVYLQRSCYVILLFAFPCWMILINTETILVLLGQEPVVSNIAADYIINYMPVIPVIFLYHIFSKYLRNQNIIMPTIVASAVGVLVTALGAYLMVNVWDMGVRGCAYAQLLGFVVMAAGNILYAVLSPNCRECWDGFTWDALQEWGEFTNLAVYGMFLVLEQIGAFEIGTILAGLFGQVHLAAQTILFQIEVMSFMVPIGVGVACNIRIGHLLGANDPVQTRRSIYVGYGIIWTLTATIAVLLASLRYQIPRIFTDDQKVVELSANLLLIMSLYCIFEGTVGTSSGMMRGCGRQGMSALITFVGYFVIGLPIGISLMFLTELKTAGFWWGVTCGIVSQACVYVTALFCINWEKEAAEAQVRAGLANYTKQDSYTGEEDEMDDERSALLYSTTERNRSTSMSRFYDSMSSLSGRRYCGEYTSSLAGSTVSVHKLDNYLTKRELVCRRGLVLLLCVLLLIGGVVIRFTFPPQPVDLPMTVVTATATPHNTTSSWLYNAMSDYL